MKQLVLYFMFFVASSLILIQCARYFPSTNNNKQIPGETKKVFINKGKEKPVVSNTADKKNTRDSKSSNLTYTAYWPYKMLQRINDARFFNTPHRIITQYNFMISYNLLQNNRP
ncbi:hypothetical protein HDF24_10750 [Mucilaginibacter sp. X4EP1]|uniref:hypothetical protein n=1 Tax=Mucilaginibacter sp. X4EP1 TaxID=2723092 RepID=UPI002167655A|nr:hypothetical protein [Mucilaginibacter sp. X4EP1]MCS3815624.1 hypothetical protein [Mucilaginibacter sp. X4EP1]